MSLPKPAVCIILVRKIAPQKTGSNYQILLVRTLFLLHLVPKMLILVTNFRLLHCTGKET